MSTVTPKMALQLLKKVEHKIIELRKNGLASNTLEELLTNAKKTLKAKKRDKTIALLNELGSKLETIDDCSVDFLKTVTDNQSLITQAKVMGIEITEFEERVNDAINFFKAENFSKAQSIANQCKQDLIDKSFLLISELIKRIYGQLKELPKNITNGQDFQQLFNDADEALKNNDFPLAWIVTKQLSDSTTKLIEPYLKKARELAKDKIIEFQDDIEQARKNKADLTDAQEVMSELIERMKKVNFISEYKDIIDLTTAGKHALARAARRKERLDARSLEVGAKLDKAISELKELKKYCAIPNSVEELVKKAENDLASCKFDSALENIDSCSLKLDKLRAASEPKIELEFKTDNLQANLWNRAKVTISNKGLANANDVNIRFSGPLEVRRMQALDKLAYNASKTLEIGLKPDGAGSLPVDVDIEFTRPLDDKAYHDHQELWLEIDAGRQQVMATAQVSPSMHTQVKKPRSEINCIFCHSEIKKSEPIFKCDCGTIYHLDCITDLDACLNCDAGIKRRVGVTAGGIRSAQDTDEVEWE